MSASNQKVKAFHLAIGIDLIGSKTSMAASRTVDLYDTGNAVVAYSKGSKRLIKIPYANVKGMELMVDDIEGYLSTLMPIEAQAPITEAPKKTKSKVEKLDAHG